MSTEPQLPRGALSFLLKRLLPRGIRGEAIRGDLLEEYRAIASRSSVRQARAWYRRQSLGILWAAVLGRIPRASHRPDVGISVIDLKLGLRMLVKHPGLTIVAAFTLAVGIPIGLYPMHLMKVFEAPLPVDEGHRIQVLRYHNAASFRSEMPPLSDFVRWREELTAFATLGAATVRATHNVISDDGRATSVSGAEVTASMFDMLRVGPLLGRPLLSADEEVGAPNVVVVSQDFWQSRLAGVPDVIGKPIRIGGVSHIVVGVMPMEFHFPYRDQLWVPLRANEFVDEDDRLGRSHVVFGRLQDGVSVEEALAEFEAVGRRMAIEVPETNARLQPELVSFSIGLLGGPTGGFSSDPNAWAMQVAALLLLLVACANVGMLIFARTANRSSELVVRTALGASRSRVISQLFAESLVLAVLAAGLGLLVADRIVLGNLDWFLGLAPYWLDFRVTRTTVLQALVLAVFSAGVLGIVPAIRITGKGIQRNLRRTGPGRFERRFGGVSSVLVVGDVALAIATVAMALSLRSGLQDGQTGTTGLPDEFLSAEVTIPPPLVPIGPGVALGQTDDSENVANTQGELVRRLKEDARVRGVAVGSALPGMNHPVRLIEVEGETGPTDYRRFLVPVASVDTDFFSALGQPILEGRPFDSGDLGENSSAVIVDSSFVARVLRGNPIGRQVRYVTRADQEAGPWYEIVGVVSDLGMVVPLGYEGGGMYHPLALGQNRQIHLAAHVGDDPAGFSTQLRTLAIEVDPAAILSDPIALHEVVSTNQLQLRGTIWGSAILFGILLALAISSVYALMSHTVAQRTREIGVRVALGARRSDLAFTIAKRYLAQLGVGLLIGAPLARSAIAIGSDIVQSPTRAPFLISLAASVSVMLLIGILACSGPTMRALRITPTDALRAES